MLLQTDRYQITSDQYQFILKMKKIRGKDSKKAGEVYWVDATYHPSLESLFKEMMKRELLNSGEMGDFSELLWKLDEFAIDFAAILNKENQDEA